MTQPAYLGIASDAPTLEVSSRAMSVPYCFRISDIRGTSVVPIHTYSACDRTIDDRSAILVKTKHFEDEDLAMIAII